jgi:hypothetical protein
LNRVCYICPSQTQLTQQKEDKTCRFNAIGTIVYGIMVTARATTSTRQTLPGKPEQTYLGEKEAHKSSDDISDANGRRRFLTVAVLLEGGAKGEPKQRTEFKIPGMKPPSGFAPTRRRFPYPFTRHLGSWQRHQWGRDARPAAGSTATPTDSLCPSGTRS